MDPVKMPYFLEVDLKFLEIEPAAGRRFLEAMGHMSVYEMLN